MKYAKIVTLALLVCALFSFRNTADKAAATVNRVQGLYVFADCQPVADYEVLGVVKFAGTTRFGSTQYQAIRDKLIKRALEDYPMGEGIVFDFNKGSADKAEVIKFK